MYLVKELFYYGYHSLSKFGKIQKAPVDFYHLTFVLEGTFTYIADGNVYVLKKNDALLLPPGTMRERLGGDHSVKFVIFNFHIDKGTKIPLDLFMKSAINRNIKDILEVYPNIKYYSIQQEQSYETKKANDLMKNILNCILIELIDSKKHTTNNPHVKKALHYIDNNITSPISLSDVSRAIHLTKEYTAKIFKDEMNMTVTDYINKQKMNLAKEMLLSNEMALQDISLNLGFENYSYFSKLFKKHFNRSPMKIKRKKE